jgi:hypothetical protein
MRNHENNPAYSGGPMNIVLSTQQDAGNSAEQDTELVTPFDREIPQQVEILLSLWQSNSHYNNKQQKTSFSLVMMINSSRSASTFGNVICPVPYAPELSITYTERTVLEASIWIRETVSVWVYPVSSGEY